MTEIVLQRKTRSLSVALRTSGELQSRASTELNERRRSFLSPNTQVTARVQRRAQDEDREQETLRFMESPSSLCRDKDAPALAR
jgi:hypothetical protein